MESAKHTQYARFERHSKAKAKSANKKRLLVYAALAIIAIYAFASSIVFLSGPSFFGDDTVYLDLAYNVLTGSFQQSQFIFSTRLLQIFPIAMFYWLFGKTVVAGSLWDIFAFVGTVVTTFYIGKLLYNEYAGLIAALLMSFFPRIVILSTTISEDVTMTFVSALLVAFILFAEKENSRKWYFLAGLFLVAPFLVTPEGFIAAVFAVFYLLVELARKKIKVNRTSLFFVYGVIVSLAILIAVNYLSTASPHNVLVTFTTNLNFYSSVGGPNHIPSTDTSLNFYISQMFPYGVLNAFKQDLAHLSLNPVSIWNQVYVLNYNKVGFYFYAFVVAAIYLIIRRERRSYVPLFWFGLVFAYLELGPMHIGLHPFSYLLSYRLGRFLTILTVPVALTISFAIMRAVEKGSRIKRPVAMAIAVVGLVFLIASSIPLNMFWHNATIYETYDQKAIANYIDALPSSTKVYFSGAFAMTPIFAHFDNISRFIGYDSIENCSAIPVGSYVILPKYQQIFNLNYTLYPEKYCPDWKLVLYPTIKGNYSQSIVMMARAFGARLYQVTGKVVPLNQSSLNQSSSNQSSAQHGSGVAGFNFFNLTGAGIINNTSHKLQYFVTINNVSAVYISLNKTSARPGENVTLNVTFVGNFTWQATNGTIHNATTYYLNSPVINIHYFGVELANQSGMLLDQNNGPWYSYINISEPYQHFYGSPSRYLRLTWTISPRDSAAGKTLKLCGGYFATFQNTTLLGGWAFAYGKLSYRQLRVINASAINVPSDNCSLLRVQ